MKSITIPNEELIPLIIEELHSTPGKTVTLPLYGYSMRPFLENGRDKGLLIAPRPLLIGDVVLAVVDDGRYVLHRIVAFDGDRVTLRGDGNLSCEYCMMSDIKALALGFYRKGRNTLDSTYGLKWRVYSWFWTRLLPIRRYLLFLLYPHIPARFKKKK